MTVLSVFLCMGGLAFLDCRKFWIIIAAASIFMVTDVSLVADLHYYYSYAALPIAFYCSLKGLELVREKWGRSRWLTPSLYAAFGLMIFIQLFLPTKTDGYRHWPFPYDERKSIVPEIVNLIPDDVAVVAQNDLYTRVPNRSVKLPLTVAHLELAEYVFLDSKGRLVIPQGEGQAIGRIINSDEFELVFEGNGFQLLRRIAEPAPLLYTLPDEPIGFENEPAIDEILEDE